MKLAKIVSFLLWIIITASVPASGECPFSEDANVAVLISFLQVHQSAEQNPCTDQAFERLNSLRPNSSNLTDEQIQVLIRFLDYRRLPTAAEQKGFPIHFSPQYPAVGSISVMGSKANNLLLSALGGSGTTSVFRENAAFAWSLIHRDDPSGGVRALTHAAAVQSDPERASNLKDAAITAARNCPAGMKEKCNSELPR